MKNIKANLRALGTQVEAAQRAASSAGVKCMISSVRIYERLDKTQALQDKVKFVKRKLKK